MTGIYYTSAAAWLRDAGLTVVEVDGWKTRARSSGGFASPPLGIQWHHTASSTTPENDTNWQYFNSDDAPIGNMTIMRDGVVWIGAAGAANTAGKGGPLTLSRGTVPLDGGNSRTWAFEVANNGVGEPWPQVQVDAYFTASNELNFKFGNQPTDVFTHAGWCEPSCPGRKVDPARADAVQGPWQPRAINSSGTWNQDDVRAECQRRWVNVTVPPIKPPEPEPQGDDMLFICKVDGVYYVGDGVTANAVPSGDVDTLKANVEGSDTARWRHPARSGLPILTKMSDVPAINAGQRNLLVGKV